MRVMCSAVMAAVLVFGGTVAAEIHTVGHQEQDSGTRSWLESWTVDFGTRTAITDVGPAKSGLFGSPHDAIGVGDINNANAGDEFILGRADGFGVVIKKDGSTPRIGGALVFRRDGVNSHTETFGFTAIEAADLNASPGKEIVTIAKNAVMEVWAYDQTTGTIDTGQGSNGRVDIREWNNIDLGNVIDVTLGEFDSSNAGLEVALLRDDGFVDIFSVLATASGQRLAISHLPGSSLHEPWDHFFSGDLDGSNPGDEIATIGSDGWLESYLPLTGARIAGLNNAYSKSGHDPFLAVTADAIPEPLTLLLLAGGAALIGRRRR